MGLGTGPGMYVCSLTPRGWAWEPAWECMCVASLPGDGPRNRTGNVCVCVYSCSQSRDEPCSLTEFIRLCMLFCNKGKVRQEIISKCCVGVGCFEYTTNFGLMVTMRPPCSHSLYSQSYPTRPCSLPTGHVTESNTTPTGCVNVWGSHPPTSFCKTNL